MHTVMRQALTLSGKEDEIIYEWKRVTFRMTLAYALIPLTVPLIIGFAAVGVWKMAVAVLTLLLAFLASYTLAGKKQLALAVYFAVSFASLVNYYYLLFMGNCDGLYFIVFMIILAGIFLNPIAAFSLALTQTAILICIAFFSPEYTVFPDLSCYFGQKELVASISQKYFSTVIILCIVSAFISILFQKYIHDLLKKIKSFHEERVVLESELFQAQKLQSIGLLAGGIAHDFGHGLTSIKSCANLILKKVSGKHDDLAEYAQNIFNVCTVIGESTGKLLAFTRRNRPDMSPVNLHEVIESMVNMLGFMLDKSIEIQTDLQAEYCTVKGNFAQLQNVIMNLSINASDAMPNGGTLAFITENQVEAADTIGDKPPSGQNDTRVVLKVTDTGTGMDEGTKAMLFSPFFTTKGPEKGTGLGLSIIKRVIDGHNGGISIISECEKGTTVVIQIPVIKT